MQTVVAIPLPDLAEILKENPGWLDEAVNTAGASRITGDPVKTLETKRVRGGGPEFIKLGKSVRYTRRACFEYLAAGRRRSTSDPGDGAAAAEAEVEEKKAQRDAAERTIQSGPAGCEVGSKPKQDRAGHRHRRRRERVNADPGAEAA